MEQQVETFDRDIHGRTSGLRRDGKYLTFTLAGEEYGIGILKVREIIGMMSITTIPRTPHYVAGVINLRGKVIPVIDLRLKFKLDSVDHDERTCIIVVEVDNIEGTVLMGIVVDTVSEVLNIKESETEETPSFGNSVSTDYIHGMAKVDGAVKILLDIDKILSAHEVLSLQDAV